MLIEYITLDNYTKSLLTRIIFFLYYLIYKIYVDLILHLHLNFPEKCNKFLYRASYIP